MTNTLPKGERKTIIKPLGSRFIKIPTKKLAVRTPPAMSQSILGENENKPVRSVNTRTEWDNKNWKQKTKINSYLRS